MNISKLNFGDAVVIVALGALIYFLFDAADYRQKTKDQCVLAEKMLIHARMSGMCAAYKQIIKFQEATNVKHGNEFASKFFLSEASRRGLTRQELTDACTDSIESYINRVDLLQQVEPEAR